MRLLHLTLLVLLCIEVATVSSKAVTAKRTRTKDDPAPAGEGTADANAPTAGDEVESMIGKMMTKGSAAPSTMQALGDTGSKIALANENTVHKEGSDDDTQDEISREAATKKQYESTEKADQEEKHKINGEARQKKIDLNRQKMYAEEREKNFEDNLHLMTEQSSKQNREQRRKQSEEGKKKQDSVTREVDALERKRQRDSDINQAKISASEATAKDKTNFMVQQTQEEIRKLSLQSKRRRDEEQRKHDIKMKRRTQMFEAEQQKFRIDMERKQEEQSKIMKRTMEDSEKANQAAKEQTTKYQHKNAVGKTCGACTPVRTSFATANAWQSCPVGTFISSISRDASSGNLPNDVSRVSGYECCRPCREDGTTPLSVSATACYIMKWDADGDCSTEGGKRVCKCQENTYVAGLYRGPSEKTGWRGILQAKCCPIDASRGSVLPCSSRTTLSELTGTGTTTQRFTADTFLSGFVFKATAATLSDIKSIDCSFYAYVV